MSTPNPVEASTSTPDASTAPRPSRGVNEGHQAHSANGTTSKDASATPAARRVPAPLLVSTAIAALAWVAIPLYVLSHHQ